MDEAKRCRGQCCRNFVLPLSPDDLQESARIARGERGEPTDEELARGVCGTYQDIEVMADMVIYLGHFALDAAAYSPLFAPEAASHRYTCRHLQANGDCGIYETRPQMCREYPYDRYPCQWAGCERGPLTDEERAANKARYRAAVIANAVRLRQEVSSE